MTFKRVIGFALMASLVLALVPFVAAGTTVAAPETVIVDDLSAGFTRKGNGWRSSSGGFANHHFWTKARIGVVTKGIWRATLEPGEYKILAKIPGRHASTRAALYKVKTTDGFVTRRRNQKFNRGSWVSLGSHELPANAVVRLSDRTGDLRGRRVAFDAVKFVPRSFGGTE